MSTHHVRRVLAALVAVVAGTRPCVASSFTVNPTQVFLTSQRTSALLMLRNESDEALRFQLTLFKWDQSAQGEMKLQPTEDIVFFPALLTLAPRESRNVRIGALAGFDATEKTYRIFVEELPPQTARDGEPSVRVLTKMGIPIFLQPAKTRAQAGLRDLAIKDGVLRFNVYNTGNVHFVPESVRIQGSNRAGEIVIDKAIDSWYILAGGVRAYELALPTPACTEVTALSVAVQFHAVALKERLETPPAACVR